MSSASVSKPALITGWVLSVLPALAMFMSATMKFLKPPAVLDGMEHFGWPARMLLILGVVETTCAVLYLLPRTAALGAILVTGYLGGAVATHARLGDPNFVTPALLGVLVWLGLFLRDRRVRALIPFRS